MKRTLQIILLLIGIATNLLADIDAQIKAIEDASPQERYKLMNAFKREIVQMKESERIKALKKLSIINRSKHARSVLQEISRKKKTPHIKAHTTVKREDEIDNGTKHVGSETINEYGESEMGQEIESIEAQTENETQENIDNQMENETSSQTEESVQTEPQNHIEHKTEEHNND
jgi:hypothetical protein